LPYRFSPSGHLPGTPVTNVFSLLSFCPFFMARKRFEGFPEGQAEKPDIKKALIF
jgi:hypothetical protein